MHERRPPDAEPLTALLPSEVYVDDIIGGVPTVHLTPVDGPPIRFTLTADAARVLGLALLSAAEISKITGWGVVHQVAPVSSRPAHDPRNCFTCANAGGDSGGFLTCSSTDSAVYFWRNESTPGGVLAPNAANCPGYESSGGSATPPGFGEPVLPARGDLDTSPTNRRLQVLSRLADMASHAGRTAIEVAEAMVMTRDEYPDVFADLAEHLAQVAEISRGFDEPADPALYASTLAPPTKEYDPTVDERVRAVIANDRAQAEGE